MVKRSIRSVRVRPFLKKSQIARFMYNSDGVGLLGSRDEDSHKRSEQQRCIGKRVLYLDVKGNNKSLHIRAGLSHHMSSGRFCQTSTLSVPHSTAERPSSCPEISARVQQTYSTKPIPTSIIRVHKQHLPPPTP